MDQLASAANVASSPHKRQGNSFNFSFTPLQPDVASTPHNNSSGRSEISANFTPVQQEVQAITPREETVRNTNNAVRLPQILAVAHQPSHSTLDMGHLELLHHFIAVTSYAISPGGPGRELWRMTVPKIALSHDWLMHSILAMSALHLAHLRPEQKRMYRERAAMHQDQALRGQQKALSKPTRENADALFAFTLVITYLAFAAVDTRESANDGPLRRVIQCLHMLRGVAAIHPAVMHFVEEGPLAPILSIHPGTFKSSPLFRDTHTESHFSKLLVFASTNGDVNDDQQMNDTESYAAAASSLRASFLKVEAIPEGQPTTPPIWAWATRLSATFMIRVGERNAVPLVLVAHWCVLLAQVHHYWFIQGWIDQAMGEITSCLATQFHTWLNWPNAKIQEIRRANAEDGG